MPRIGFKILNFFSQSFFRDFECNVILQKHFFIAKKEKKRKKKKKKEHYSYAVVCFVLPHFHYFVLIENKFVYFMK